MPYKSIDPKELSKKEAYFLGISLIIPRPIAFITSLNEDSSVNAAPFSYFNGISTKPFLFMVSIAKRKGEKKDTAKNILERKYFCVNLVTKDMLEGVTISSADFPYGESEMKYNGFHLVPSVRIPVPGIQESPVRMESQLIRAIEDLGDFTLIIGEALLIHVREDLLDEKNHLDPIKSQIVGRIGGIEYIQLGERIPVPRKDWREYNPISK